MIKYSIHHVRLDIGRLITLISTTVVNHNQTHTLIPTTVAKLIKQKTPIPKTKPHTLPKTTVVKSQ